MDLNLVILMLVSMILLCEWRIPPLSATCANISIYAALENGKNLSYIINHLTNNIPTMLHVTLLMD